MLARSPEKIYAQIPLRTISDKRLAALHFRMLAAVSWYSRSGKCWAALQTLADKCKCDYTRASATLCDLVSWGYLRRLKRGVYAVIHDTTRDTKFADPQTSREKSLPIRKLRARQKRKNGFDHQWLNGDGDAPNRLYEIVDE